MWQTWLKVKTYRILEGKREGKRQLEITRSKYKNSIQIKPQGGGGLQLNSHGSVAGCFEESNEHSRPIKCGELLVYQRTY
jgi:hypothetical protein